jgi:metallo-beta-lactamase family protein
MQIKLRFLGAAQNVTGSRHMLEVNGTRLLVDCGLYQERQFKERNWEPFDFPASSINAVLLTHAHLDHCGLLPKLVKEGFAGPVYCTAATAEIARIILLDSARLQEEDAEYKRKRHEKEGREGPHEDVPLYTTADAEACFPLFRTIKYRQPVGIADGIVAQFCEAGHVLGSAVIKVGIQHNGESRSVLFSGDLGRPNGPIIRDPSLVDEADYILVESTYGDRVHAKRAEISGKIAEVINETVKAGGNIVVPSFALERSQEILYYMNELLLEKTIPPLMVFLDSPMAGAITKVFRHHPELYDAAMTEFIQNGQSPFAFHGLKVTETSKESKAINTIRGTIMVIAGSGMCTGGRIKHHLVNNIERPESTIMFVGYQATGTLGRRLVDGDQEVRILGENRQVRAKIVQIHGFSAHADKEEILTWLGSLKHAPRKVFIVHGEAESSKHFGRYLQEKTGWNVVVPQFKDEVVLD